MNFGVRRLIEVRNSQKKILEEERKRKEKIETERDRGLQKKLVTMEAGINRTLEAATEIIQAL